MKPRANLRAVVSFPAYKEHRHGHRNQDQHTGPRFRGRYAVASLLKTHADLTEEITKVSISAARELIA